MRNWVYIKLTDHNHKNQIVRVDKGFQQRFENGKWIRTALMMHYYVEGAKYHDMYEYITEAEATKIIGKEAIGVPT